MAKRKVTVAEAIEAMSQNNIPHNTGSLTSESTRAVAGVRVVKDACALGQCALNLGATPSSLQDALSQIKFTGFGVYIGSTLSSYIISQNDSFKLSPDKTAAKVLKLLTLEQLEQIIEVDTDFSVVLLKGS